MPSCEFLEQTNIIATNFLLVDWANKHLIKNNQITPIANRRKRRGGTL